MLKDWLCSSRRAQVKGESRVTMPSYDFENKAILIQISDYHVGKTRAMHVVLLIELRWRVASAGPCLSFGSPPFSLTSESSIS